MIRATLSQPQLLPFLPIVYAVWADGELNDIEVEHVQGLIDAQTSLPEDVRVPIHDLLDPAQPPTAVQLVTLLDIIQEHAQGLSEEGVSLAELGTALCGEGGCDLKTSEALSRLEQALGVSGQEVARTILSRPQTACAPATYRDLEPEPSFDPMIMKVALDGPYMETKDAMRELLKQPAFRYHYELDKGDEREVVLEWLKILAREGYGRMAYPDVLHTAPDMGPFMAAFETLAYFDLSLVIKYGVQFGLFGGSIYFLGTKRHHALLEQVADAEMPGCFAMTELGHGSNVRDLKTKAIYDHSTKEWIIHTPDELARKEWIGNAALHAQMATVFAQLEVNGEGHGVHAFLVRIRDEQGNVMPNVSIDDCGHKMGLNGVDNGRIWFDNVRIPADNLLNRFADIDEQGQYTSPIQSSGKRFFTMLGTLVGGRVSIASAALSASKSALTIATRYGAMRRQFGPAGRPETPILDFRTHQRRLMPLLAKSYALSFGVQYLQQRYLGRSEQDEREVEGLAAGLKAYSSWHATHTIQIARECCGGQGYLTVNRLVSLKADTDIFTTFEGDNIVLLQLLAKGLLTQYGQQFQDMDVSKALRLVRSVVSDTTTRLDFITSRRTDASLLRDHKHLAELLDFRDRSLVASAARRFKRRLDEGMDSFMALIEVQDHLISLAQAHIESLLMTQFIEAVETSQDPQTREALSLMCTLYGLERVESDLAWFLENEVIEPSKSKAIRDEVNALCLEVRKQAIGFTDAFAISDEVISAPIARSIIVPSDQSPATLDAPDVN